MKYKEVIEDFAEGNVGGITAMIALLGADGLECAKLLDEYGIYGARIHALFVIAGRKALTAIALLEAVCRGLADMSERRLDEAIEAVMGANDHGIDVVAVRREVPAAMLTK